MKFDWSKLEDLPFLFLALLVGISSRLSGGDGITAVVTFLILMELRDAKSR